MRSSQRRRAGGGGRPVAGPELRRPLLPWWRASLGRTLKLSEEKLAIIREEAVAQVEPRLDPRAIRLSSGKARSSAPSRFRF